VLTLKGWEAIGLQAIATAPGAQGNLPL